MDTLVIAVVAGGSVAPFVVLWWVLRRGSRGGKVRSLASRKESGRRVDEHAATDGYEAASAANSERPQPRGPLKRVRRWLRRLRRSN